MGETTPNIGIYLPANGETNFLDSFNAGQENVDAHDHSGGPNKGVKLTSAALADGSITYNLLSNNVVDTSTGLTTSATNPNQIQTAGILKSINALGTNGLLVRDGTTAFTRTLIGMANQIAVTNADGTMGNPTLSLPANVINTLQTSFCYGAAVQNSVTGDGTLYTVQFTDNTFYGEFQQGSAYDGTSNFTAPVAGVYLFGFSLQLTNINAGSNNSTELSLYINGTQQYQLFYCDSSVITKGDQVTFNCSQVIHLAAADVVTATLKVSNTAVSKIVSITKGKFFGTLLC